MTEFFRFKLEAMQPSQLYISRKNLGSIVELLDEAQTEAFEPIPIVRVGKGVVMTDGHTRALVAFIRRMRQVPVNLDRDEIDLEACQICVDWCKLEGIRTVGDLRSRVVPHERFEVLWIQRCHRMHQELARRRARD